MKLEIKKFETRNRKKGHGRKRDYMKGVRNDKGRTRNLERNALGRRRLRYKERGEER
jgi:hypothetical protein